MLKKIVRKIRKLLRRFLGIPEQQTRQGYVDYLRELGCTIGERVIFFDPKSTMVDITRPWLIEIGNDVQIPYGVSILTHGYDWSVLKGIYGDVLGSAGKVKIGNNVFIGAKSIILKGNTIGNNVIIGAGSVVSNNIPDNVVAAGNPCRVIMTIDEYYLKRQKAQLNEATELVREYRKKYHKNPDENVLSEFFFLFNHGGELHDSWKAQMRNVGNYDATYKCLCSHESPFDSMQNFLDSIE